MLCLLWTHSIVRGTHGDDVCCLLFVAACYCLSLSSLSVLMLSRLMLSLLLRLSLLFS